MHTRNALSLANIGYQKMLTWDRPEPMSLEEQVLIPLLGTSPIEMGIADMQPQVLERLRAEPFYASQFPLAFPESPQPISIANVAKAIAAFERMLISRNSPFDRFLRGDHGALGSKAQAGYTLFSSERLGCTHCHSGPLLNLPKDGGSTPGFFNIGLYALKDTLRYPLRSRGLAVRTGKDQDDGKFRTPSLHNVALTRPYMHDGSVPTLEAVLDLYAAGGRNIQSEIPEHGDGRLHPFKDPRIRGFALSSDEKSAMIAFLESLTDPDFLHSTSLADPWPAGG